MKTEHTPAPWQASATGVTKLSMAQARIVEVWNANAHPLGDAVADVRLIEAAPDLLKACQLLYSDLGRMSPAVFDEEISEAAKLALDAAIRKATGQE